MVTTLPSISNVSIELSFCDVDGPASLAVFNAQAVFSSVSDFGVSGAGSEVVAGSVSFSVEFVAVAGVADVVAAAAVDAELDAVCNGGNDADIIAY